MANIDLGVDFEPKRVRSAWALVGVFTASIFLSATLLFSVQPMFAKLVLPLLGGSSSVWNTAMVFFQLALLSGYIYAHLISKYFKLGAQVILHGLVLTFGCLFLPLSIAEGWTPPETGIQAFWLIGLFAISIGAPFFAISANAPLLQRWFSQTDSKDANDPYFLYSASNAGSLLSLCLYPIVFEPMLRLREQTALWSIGYVLLIFSILGAGYFAIARKKPDIQRLQNSDNKAVKTTNRQRLIWIALAFIPSSLMLGVTSHMTNNIASAPFLWILPLALYLLTFIIVFAKTPIVSSKVLSYITPIAIVFALLFGVIFKDKFFLSITISLGCYFIIALASHMRLVETRPSAERLTEFYIWMSFGGVLGGAFNALVAPIIFNRVYEYVLVLGLACLVYYKFDPELTNHKARNKSMFETICLSSIMFIILLLTNASMIFVILMPSLYMTYKLQRLSATPRLTMYSTLCVVAFISFLIPLIGQKKLLTERSFFGVMKVEAKDSPYGPIHKFYHGDTMHNFQFQDQTLRKVPLAYYSKGNTFDRGLSFARQLNTSGNLNVAMIGLGAGAMACYEKPQDNWIYFEIDPDVVKMATNSKYFSYMQDCSIKSDIRVGDARIKFDKIPLASQDYIIVDAFSSDSIPAHLLTVEALELYRSRLKPNGLVFFHTSNRVLDVSSVVTNLAENANLDSRYIELLSFPESLYPGYDSASSAVIIGTHSQMDNIDDFDDNWTKRIPSPDVGLWSDDYSHIIGTLKAKYNNNAKVMVSLSE